MCDCLSGAGSHAELDKGHSCALKRPKMTRPDAFDALLTLRYGDLKLENLTLRKHGLKQPVKSRA